MPSSSSLNSSQNLKVGASTISAHTITANAPVPHSFHDCTDPGLAGLHNCVWPSDYVNASGSKTSGSAPTAVGVSVTKGLTIMFRTTGGNISTTYS